MTAHGRIAFQGVAGAYSEEAAGLFDPAMEAVGYPTFDGVFDALVGGDVEFAMCPLENSIAGVVQPVSDLFWEHADLGMVAEVVLPIHHLLLGHGEPVTAALSHPVALAQCGSWLAAHGVEPVPFFDTAGAAREVATRPEHLAPGTAAIAGRRAADHYGLRILATDIADSTDNRTRFGVVRRGGVERPLTATSGKLSLGLTAAHRPGGLYEILGIFMRHRANLTRLDSRPVPSAPFTYRFYIDAEVTGSQDVELLVAELQAVALEVRVFGVYAPVR